MLELVTLRTSYIPPSCTNPFYRPHRVFYGGLGIVNDCGLGSKGLLSSKLRRLGIGRRICIFPALGFALLPLTSMIKREELAGTIVCLVRTDGDPVSPAGLRVVMRAL